MTRAILHIGTAKTGTTALQSALAEGRPVLDAHGYLYSRAAGLQNHARLAAYASDDEVRDGIRRRFGIRSRDDLRLFRKKLKRELQREQKQFPGRTTIFSNEHCHSRLLTETSVLRLRDLLSSIFDEIDVIVYLRRQDELSVSRYSTILKGGGTATSLLDVDPSHRAYYDYRALLERWRSAFGADRVSVARFERSRLAGGSIVSDFCARLGLPVLKEPTGRVNESLGPAYQEFLRLFNERVPLFVEGKRNPDRAGIDKMIARLGAGTGARPARADAIAFVESFAESNDWVRSTYFPDDDTLFSTDFSAYPKQAVRDELDLDRTMDIVASLWTAAATERRALRERVARQKRATADD